MSFIQSIRTKKPLRSITKFVAHKYQDKCIKFMLDNPFAGVLLTPGLGKTIIVLMFFLKYRKKKPKAKMIVVSTVRIIHSVWPSEVEKWGLPFKVSMMHKKTKETGFDADADIYLTNFDNLTWLQGKLRGKDRYKFEIMVIDESSKIKNTRTKRFKAIKKIAPLFERRYILTGSPIPNGLKDIFGQVYFLDLGASLGRYITGFLTEYFYPSGYMGYEWRLQERAEFKVYKKLSHLLIRFGKEELDLPPITYITRHVELPKDARKVYDDLEKDFIADLESGVIVASNAASSSSKLRQIASGNVYDENKKSIYVHNEKIEELKEIVDEMQGEPLLVAYEFNHELAALLKAFPKTPHIGGSVSAKRGKEIEGEWNRGELPLLFGQTSTVSHGLNLQESGCTLALYSMTWNLEDHEQLIQRLYRQGQKLPVTIISIVARDTIEERMINVVNTKDYTQKKMLHHIKAYYLESNRGDKDDMSINSAEWFRECVERSGVDMPTYKRGHIQNFVEGLIDILRSWGHTNHAEFLSGISATDFVETKDDLEALYAKSRAKLFEIFCIREDVTGKFAVDNVKIVSKYASKLVNKTPEREPRGEAYTDLETKTQRKRKVKSPTLSKSAEKEEVAVKKAASKKKVAKKVTAEPIKNRSNTADSARTSRADYDKYVAKVTKLMQRKKGCSIEHASEKVGIPEKTVHNIIAKIKKSGQSVTNLGNRTYSM